MRNKKSGFSLLDVIVAIGITLTGLVGVLGLLRYVTIAARYSAERFIAKNLAEEGIELVRAIRDTNWKEIASGSCDPGANPDCWREGLKVQGNYTVDYSEDELTDNSRPYTTLLNLDANNFYTYQVGTQTKFFRRIAIYLPGDAECPSLFVSEGIADSENFCVYSEVNWRHYSDSNYYSISVKDRLFNWR